MQAIILAAGMGRRLRHLTSCNTKCMVEVDGEKLIDRLLAQLASLSLDRIVIVTGYEGAKLRSYLTDRYGQALPIEFVDNPVYDKTNNIYSLWLAREYLTSDDTLLIESDLIFADGIIDLALYADAPNVALVAKYEPWMDGTMVTLTSDGQIDHFVAGNNLDFSETHSYYKTVNVYKLSAEFSAKAYLPILESYIKVCGNNEYYEQALKVLTFIDNTGIRAVDIGSLRWYEIDDIQDLRIAETLFAKGNDRLNRLQATYGGYWRYPFLLDFCYLVNPYFPTPSMEGEMKARFSDLLRQYPSGMGVNALLAGKCFGINEDMICPGNGAAEIIKSLMERMAPEERLGFVEPTFEEYPNRRKRREIVPFRPSEPSFRYDADDLIAFFTANRVDTLLIINPDNPSGNFIGRDGIERLALWADRTSTRLVIDESFVDFADDSFTLIDEDFLESHPQLIVIKSISKSYGVPGLRLGVAASADRSLIASLKRDLAIWNINSFAEYYMQIFGKYERHYEKACRLIRDERNRLGRELSLIRALSVVPSQANYFLCAIDPSSGYDSRSLTLALLERYDILIKDCSSKHGFDSDLSRDRYVRIAVRDRRDNDRLLEALNQLL